MRRSLALLGLISIAACALAAVGDDLSKYAKTLLDAKSVRAMYTVQTIGAAPGEYTVILKKPNLARIETPERIYVSDGKKLTTYDRTRKLYYRTATTDKDLQTLFLPDELSLFGGFFSADAYKSVRTQDLGSRTLNGVPLNAVESTVTANGRKTVTYYLDPATSLARKSQIEIKDPRGPVTTIVDAKNVVVDGTIKDDTFNFVGPDGSREVSVEEFGARWYDNLEEAKIVAASTKRRLFVIFDSEISGAKQKMDKEVLNSPDFMKYANKLVFVRLDPETATKEATKYEVKVVPSFYILKADGTKEDSREGYAGRAAMLQWLGTAVGR